MIFLHLLLCLLCLCLVCTCIWVFCFLYYVRCGFICFFCCICCACTLFVPISRSFSFSTTSTMDLSASSAVSTVFIPRFVCFIPVFLSASEYKFPKFISIWQYSFVLILMFIIDDYKLLYIHRYRLLYICRPLCFCLLYCSLTIC